ncbi:MAG: alanine/glycine:cation symporter family protein [Planctomycetota bacterium]
MKRLLLGLVLLFAAICPTALRAQESGALGSAQSEPAWYERGGALDQRFGAWLDSLSYWPFYNLYKLGHSERDKAGEIIVPPLVDATGAKIKGPNGQDVVPNLPLVVVWLVIGAVFFTLTWRFANFRLFGHAIKVVRGHYDNPEDHGEVTHFQALASALSATVGLGNIAGVAIAISLGGPGATIWMIVAGLLGMSLKFTECTLGQIYRKIDSEGRVSGGPMHYLYDGFKKRGDWLAPVGFVLSGVFTVFCIGGSLAGGNSFQVNQALDIVSREIPFFADNGWAFGALMAVAVGVVIIGGIKRIAQTAEKIVPVMCGLYVLACLAVIVGNAQHIPTAFAAMFRDAFTGDAMYGGAIGALVMGFRRAAFSNEAGVGSASIAHSAAKTEYPVREGIVALLEPFIDTVVVCTMTALVIVLSEVYDPAGAHADLVAGGNGAALTRAAFQTVDILGMATWFPYLLLAAVVLFAYSTMISWSYYGERCFTRIFGARSSLIYKVIFIVFVVLGSICSARNVLEFGDLMILLMAFPNILGLFVLQGDVRRDLVAYEQKLKSGQMPVFK